MSRPIIRIHNIETDQVIDREMTVAEFDQHKANLELDAERQAEADAKATQKAALLERLGITEDEARLLLG
jgi:hypothetical protein